MLLLWLKLLLLLVVAPEVGKAVVRLLYWPPGTNRLLLRRKVYPVCLFFIPLSLTARQIVKLAVELKRLLRQRLWSSRFKPRFVQKVIVLRLLTRLLALYSWLLNVKSGGLAVLEPGLLCEPRLIREPGGLASLEPGLLSKPGEARVLEPGLLRELGEASVLWKADWLVDVVGVLKVSVHHVSVRVPLNSSADVWLIAGFINRNELLVSKLKRSRTGVEPKLGHVEENHTVGWISFHTETLNARTVRGRRCCCWSASGLLGLGISLPCGLRLIPRPDWLRFLKPRPSRFSLYV